MSNCDHTCTKCDRKSCIEFKPKMAAPRELQTDYEMMITANLLMTASIESFKCKNDQLQAENAKLWELAHAMLQYIDPASHQDTCNIECPAYSMCKGKSMCAFPSWAVKEARKLGIEVRE